jgi:diguanylate cyclase (GGDEF)-like protein
MNAGLAWLLDSPAEVSIDRLTSLTSRLIGVPVALVSIVDSERQFFKSQIGLAEPWATRRETPLTHSFCKHVVASGEPLAVEDARKHPLVRDNLAIRDLNVVAYLGVPLRVSDGSPFGALCAIDGRPRHWTPGELEILRDLAASVISEIELRQAMRMERAQHLAMRRAYHQLDMAGELLGLGYWRFEFKSERMTWSAQTFRIFGRDPALGAPPADEIMNSYFVEDRERLRRARNAVQTTGQMMDERCRLRRPDGEVREVVIRAAPELSESGEAVAVDGIVFDVTEINRAEREARLRSRLFARTLEIMDQGLIMIDEDSRVQIYNRWARELFDVPEEMLRQKPKFSDIIEFQASRGEFDGVDPARMELFKKHAFNPMVRSTYMRETPAGRIIEVRTVPFPEGGAVRTYTDITELKAAETEIARAARHDLLTELPNRLHFHEKLARMIGRAKRENAPFALHYLDLDRFKAVNDTFGHQAGDAVLREVARRVGGLAGPEDLVARLGGDEFAILQPGSADGAEAARLAESVVAALDDPFEIDGQLFRIGASVGISLAPADGLDADRLIKCADLALYRVKDAGRGAFRFFEPTTDPEIETRRALAVDLKMALARGEFEVHFQPILDVATGAVASCEALLRWNHPARGPIPPAIFIPIAEQTKQINEIGAWVLREVCATAASWPGDITVAVNLSAVQLERPELGATILAALSASGLACGRLELEITESVMMDENQPALETLAQLRALGVKIALDDFGTGYSSLRYLGHFALDKVKIDRSFIQRIDDPRTLSIIRAVVALSTDFGMSVTAEGIETEAQFEIIRREGCAFAQGYLFSRPQPARELMAHLERSAPPRRVALSA